MKHSAAIRNTFLLLTALLLSLSVYSQRKNKDKAKDPAQVKLEVEYLFVEAEKLFLLKNYSQATVILNECLSMQPDNDVFYYKLAEISNITEQFDQAASYIVKAIELNKKNKYYYLLSVDIYSNLGDLQSTAKAYEQLIQEVPGSTAYLFNLAAAYIYLKEFNKALETYDLAQEKYGLTEDIAFQKQKIYLQQNELEKAIDVGRQLIETYPDNPKYVLITVEILSSNNRLEEASALLKGLIIAKPEFSAARLQLAEIYWKQNDFVGFEEEVVLAFKDPSLNLNAKINLLMRYMVYLPNTNLEKLIPELVVIVTEVHPDDSNSYLIAGDIYTTFIEKNLIEENKVNRTKQLAVDNYAKYVSMEPSNFNIWQNLLNMELQLDSQDSMAVHAEQALELFPNQAWLYLVNGIAKHNQKNLSAATQLLEMGTKRASGNRGLLLVMYGYLGDIYNEMEDFEKSDAAYEKVLEIDPLNFTVLNNYSYYLSLRKVKLDQAKKMCTTLIKSNPDNTTYLDTYAWVHYHLGEYEEARRVFEKIIRIGVNEGVYYDHYGDTLYRLGETELAIEQWKMARDLDESIENVDEKINQGKIIQ